MLLASLALCIWLPALVGFGSLARVEGGPLRRAGIAGFVGLAMLAALAVALNLVLPLSPLLSATAVLGGWVLFLRARRMLLLDVRPRHFAFGVGLLVTLAALTQLPARHYDSGLYFLQSVRWAQEHAQPAGLASLHQRLGYNSSWFALAAMVEAPGLVGKSSFFLNGLPVLFAAFLAADAIGRLRAGERTASTYYFVLATFAAAYGAATLGSVYPDQPVAVLTVLSLGFWVRALEEPRELGSSVIVGALLAVFAFTAKVSSLPLLGGWGLFVALRWRALDPRLRKAAVAGIAVTLLPWAARGVICSGCVLFPATWSCLPWLSWATPKAMVAESALVIRAWARWPDVPSEQAMRGWTWFPGWLRQTLHNPHVAIPVAGAMVGTAAMRTRLLRPSPIRAPLLVTLAAVVFWFLTAPSPRFGVAYLLPAAMLPISAWAAERAPALPSWARRAALIVAIAAAAAYLQWSVRPLRKLRPDTVALASWPQFPKPDLTRRVTSRGTEIRVPVGTDQCWDSEPPCSPGYASDLRWDGTGFEARSGPMEREPKALLPPRE